MKSLKLIGLVVVLGAINIVSAEESDSGEFAKVYFDAWAATQNPDATQQDLEHYLSLLTDDVGHQHLPYDPDGSRNPTGKEDMREGMTYYLGAHTAYEASLISHMEGEGLVVIKYETSSSGIHPQTRQEISQQHVTVEALEMENGKVSVIRKYSD